jgi:16S rRNA (guanine1207-N2)-methyltransferase
MAASAGGAEHYYSQRPGSRSARRLIAHSLGGIHLSFVTDSGVFAKGGVDFGSDLLIRSMPALSGRVLDMGCGYGAVGISLKCLNPGIELHLADINERAVELCRENFELNCKGEAYTFVGAEGAAQATATEDAAQAAKAAQVARAATAAQTMQAAEAGGNAILLSDGFARVRGRFDCIAMNPPIRSGKQAVFGLYRDSAASLKEGGALYVVIRRKQGMESSLRELERVFGSCADVARKAGYHVLKAELSANAQ